MNLIKIGLYLLLFCIADVSAAQKYTLDTIDKALLTTPEGFEKIHLPPSTSSVIFCETPHFRFKEDSGPSHPAEAFIATEEGQILAYSAKVNPKKAIIVIDQSAKNAVYTGLTIARVGRFQFLYATDFFNGVVDIYDTDFRLLHSFTDEELPPGYAPFNIQHINEKLYIAYAMNQNNQPHPHGGFVEVFDINSATLTQLISDKHLNCPRGLALVPTGFGKFSGALIVGNYGDGLIYAYDSVSGKFLGRLKSVRIEGLWELKLLSLPCLHYLSRDGKRLNGIIKAVQ